MKANQKKLIVVVLSIAGVLTVGYKAKQWWVLKQKLNLQQQRLSTLQQTIELREQQLKGINYNRSESDKVQAEFLTALEQIISELNLEINNLAPRANRRHEQAVEWPVAVKISGRYPQLVSFLHQLKQLDWIIEVKTMQLAVNEDELTAVLKLSLYTLAKSS